MADILDIARIDEPDAPIESTNFYSPEILARPLGFLQKARRTSPVVTNQVNAQQRVKYLVTNYELVQFVLTHPDLFSSNYISILKGHAKDDPRVENIRSRGFEEVNSLLTSDDADHKRMRALVAQAFVPKRVKAMEGTLAQCVDDMIDNMKGKPVVDFISEFAGPLPSNALAYLLGAGKSEHANFQRWSDAIVRRFGLMGSLDERIEDERTILEAKEFMVELVKLRRERPGADLVSDLIAARDEDESKLSELEILATLFILFVGATETTFSSLIFAMAHLLHNPDMMAQLRADPDLVPLFNDEVLRFYPPIGGFWRVVRKDLTLGGVEMKAGEMLMVRVDSANRDEAQFKDPNQFDIHRPNNNRNLSFSGGAHSCLGFRLARMELNLAINALVQEFGSATIEPSRSDLGIRPSTHARCLEALHFQMEPA